MIFFWSYPRKGKKSSLLWLIILLTCLLSAKSSLFAQLPSGFSKSTVQENYTSPVGLIFSGDGNRFFVWEKSGKVWASTWNGSSYVRQSTAMIDISEEVGEWNDLGLHSICLDPNFQTNGFVYLFYVVDPHHLHYYGTPQYSSTTNMYHHATISRVTRYKVQTSGNNMVADYGSRKVLIGESVTTGIPVTFEAHAGGTILFGRDGTLFVTTGDGAHHEGVDVGSRAETNYKESLQYKMMRDNENVGALRAQMVNSMCGKILRIDPNTGDGLSSNPFYKSGNPRSAESRVWALGMRNPYRIGLKPNTGSVNPNDGNPGTLLVGDIGWFKYEDFHVIDKPGLNAGWPLYEGLETTIAYYGNNVKNLDEPGQPTFESLCVQPTSFVDNAVPTLRRFTHSRPALDYNHGPTPSTRVPAFSGSTPIVRDIGTTGAPSGTPFSGYCIVGGPYYTGSQFPDSYKNTYFIADYGQGWIKNLELHDEGDHIVHEVRNFSSNDFEPGILDLKMNPRDGSIYYVRIQGSVSRISYGGNQPPVANASSNVTYGGSPLTVQFTGSNSVDPEGFQLSYLWNFGDGTTSTLANPTHVFSDPSIRKFNVTLVVTDNQGQTSQPKEIVVSVNNTPPTAQITNPAPGTLYTMSQPTTYTLQANVVDNDLSNLKYEWQVSLHHNTHTHPEPILTSANPVITISPVGCSPNETYSYVITLKVTDNGGLTATHSVVLYPDCNSASSLVSNVTATRQVNAVQVSWINPNVAFDEILVAAKTGSVFTDKPTGTSYTADPNFNGNGSALDGGKVVYRGTGTNVTVTNLNPLFQYYFRVYTRIGNTWNGGVEVNAIPNLPPVAPTIAAPSGIPGQYYSYTIPAFTDPEGQPLVYSVDGLPNWLNFDTNNRTLTGIPTQTASYTLTISARDVGNVSTSVPVIISTGPNQSPVAPNVPTLSARVNQPFSYTVPAFTDPEGKNLSYSVTGQPGWLNFNTGSLVLSGTPTQVGSYSLTIRATDPSGLSTPLTLTVNVNNGAFDLTPVIFASPSTVVGNKPFVMVVDIYELNGVEVPSPIMVRVSKDTKGIMSFSQGATSVGGRPVQNSMWNFDSSDPDYFTLTSKQKISAGGVLSFGLEGMLSPGSTTGSLSFVAVVNGGVGEDVKNNNDSEKIEYFQQ